jgi:hypothetical protein
LCAGLCLAVGFGRGALCRAARVGLRLPRVCSCRSRRSAPPVRSLVLWPRSGGGYGCVPVPPGRRCSPLAACRFPRSRSRWRCLPVGLCVPRAWCWLGFVLVCSGVVAVAGSRSLSGAGLALVAPVCWSVVASGRSLAVGCAVGADAAALAAGLPVSALQVFAVFDQAPACAGAWRGSAAQAVADFAAVGGAVSWLAGGSLSVPLPARLAARTSAVVAQASAGCVLFFASPSSRGSALAGRLAVGRGLPVFAFPVGFPGSALPSLGAGAWVPFDGSGCWASSWLWIQSQLTVF